MEEIFNSPLIEELYEARSEEFENRVVKILAEEEREIIDKKDRLESKLEIKMMEILKIVPDESKEKMEKLFEDFEAIHHKDSEVWRKTYYKFGVLDGYKLKNELKEEN